MRRRKENQQRFPGTWVYSSLEITGDALRIADEGGIAITFNPWYRIETEIFDTMAEHLGVRYVYEELEPVGMEGPPSGTLAPTSPDLQGLLAEWLAACRSSASRGHSELLLELIDQIRADHAQVAEGLTGLVHALRFRTIVTLTEQAEGQL